MRTHIQQLYGPMAPQDKNQRIMLKQSFTVHVI